MKRKTDLAGFSIDELIEQIVRRRNAEDRAQPPEHFCDDCANFVPSDSADAKYNPCRLKHRMQFWAPDMDGNPHQEYGFYRRVCADRRPVDAT